MIFTSLSTAFGRQLLIVVAVIFFLVGTIVSGVATNFTEMLVGRSIQGTGGGGIIALSEVSVTDMIPFRLRGAYWGVLGSMWSIGSVIGPIMGGGFSTNSDWVSRDPVFSSSRVFLISHGIEMDLLYQCSVCSSLYPPDTDIPENQDKADHEAREAEEF